MDTEFIFKKERNLLDRKGTITLIYGFCKRTNMLYVMELILMWMPMKGIRFRDFISSVVCTSNRTLRYFSFQNILTNPIISQINTLLLPYFILTIPLHLQLISSTTTKPKCIHSVASCYINTNEDEIFKVWQRFIGV